MIADLTGKRALVTGAGIGIGQGIATVLAEQGALVAVADLDADTARNVADDIGESRSLALALDVTDRGSAERAVERVLAEWGSLDILVNNAGVASAPGRRFDEDDREVDWDMTFDINVKGVVHCTEAVLPHMRERRYGKIINIASIAGLGARRAPGAYAVSKAGVIRYTQGLAVSEGPFNINVNAICPGAVWTRFQQMGAELQVRNDPSLAGVDPERVFLDRYEPMMPLARVQTPEDIGKAAAFLASEDARNITGQYLNVDGGAVIQ